MLSEKVFGKVLKVFGVPRNKYILSTNFAVNVRSLGDIMTLIAAASTALRGVTTLKARAVKETRNIPVVPRTDKGTHSTGIRQQLKW
ncbi:hypothetical protein CTI12_AA177230 [Artemisia annua]|uniref:VAN3-binding protein-like auxin canalisation domain-containing protein n=1 Tax=Artemisia annua TaxID=35608 RepID=A0A2U1PA30_ARTAN|nr:hypothetical protein CTI12_AA177230 [Artemisia annua]